MVECAVKSLDTLGESPVWDVASGSLFWVDIRSPALKRFNPSTGQTQQWPLPELVGAVVLKDADNVLVCLQSGVCKLNLKSGALTSLVKPETAEQNNRLNDSKCDRAGRLWVGTMRDYGLAVSGSLYRIGTDIACKRILSDIRVPNALCWSPDDRTMYFADTGDGNIRAYTYDLASGEMSNMRILLKADAAPGRPDGATIDADGCVWSARYEGNCVVRITPDGRVDRIVEIPATRITSCAFGGSDLKTLYVTTARQKLTPEQLAREPLAGCVFAFETGTGGLPEPHFGGSA
jgi:sugar lactone lactonase YvrE